MDAAEINVELKKTQNCIRLKIKNHDGRFGRKLNKNSAVINISD